MKDPTKISSAVPALMLTPSDNDRKQTSRSRSRVPQSPSRPVSVACLNLFSVDFELDPSFATLKIFSSITKPYAYALVLVSFVWVDKGKGRKTAV